MTGVNADRPGLCVTTVLECWGAWCLMHALDESMSLMHKDSEGKYACGSDVF